MTKLKALVPLLALALGLSACATIPRVEAAGDIHAFLVSIRDGDRAAFDAHVDREALKANLRARVMAAVGRTDPPPVGGALGDLIAVGLVDVLADAFVRPEVFRAIAENRGYSPDRPLPSSLAIAQFVRPLGSGLICVVTKKDGPCLLDFRNEDGVYRLSGFEGDLSLLRPKA